MRGYPTGDFKPLNSITRAETAKIIVSVLGVDVEDVIIGDLKVHYIDVGQGDSIFIEFPTRETALIDGGPRSSGQKVLNYLDKQNVKRIDYLIAIHPHEDQIGGLIDVVNNYEIGKIYIPNVEHATKTFEDFLLAIQNKGKKITAAKAGNMIIDKKGLSVKILAPEDNFNYDNLNDYSVVIKLNYKNISFLFTGDAESLSESTTMSKGYDLKADVLKVGHHGSKTSTTDEFLSKVAPKYAVISCGLNNSYGHPHTEIINKLRARGIQIYRTDLDGTSVAISDGKDIVFEKKASEKVGDDKEVEPPITDDKVEVYVTKSGEKYHRDSCSSLRKSKIAISLKEAKKKGYEPCKICNPPR